MNLLLAVGLFCIAWFSSTFAQYRPPICCLRVSSDLNKISLNNVVDYKWQIKGVCPVTAVVVRTRREKHLCADPNIDWTKRAMKKVDMKKKRSENENKNTAALTPRSPAEGNREEVPAPSTQLPSSVAPTAHLKAGESGKTAQISLRRGKGGKKRKIKSKAWKKKGKKTANK